jgi:hypothetical protein
MIAEDVLERGLATAADEYDVPAGAIDRLREQLAPQMEANRPHLPHVTRRGWWAIAAAAAAALIAVPIALGGGTTSEQAGSAGAPSSVAPTPMQDKSAVGSGSSASGGGTTTSGAQRLGGRQAEDAPIAGPVPAPVVEDGFRPVRVPKAQPAPAISERIIKTGQLDLQVPRGEVSSTLNKLTSLATFMRGYVADSRTSEGSSTPSGQVTLRVPVDRFEDTINRARSYGTKVLSLETSSQDVTNKYVDIAARIKALKDTRETFLTLLSKATTIGETLAVQQHVTEVQTQIEQLQGQLRVLANRSGLSTLTVTVDQKASIVPAAHHQSGISKAFHKSVDRFVNGIEAIVGALGPILLIVLLVGFGWLAARFGYRILRRRMV